MLGNFQNNLNQGFILVRYFDLFVQQSLETQEKFDTPEGRCVVYEVSSENVEKLPNRQFVFSVSYIDCIRRKNNFEISKTERDWRISFADWIFHHGHLPELGIVKFESMGLIHNDIHQALRMFSKTMKADSDGGFSQKLSSLLHQEPLA